MQVNKATLGLLKLVEPFVSYGYPSLKSVKELIYKRGYAKVRVKPMGAALSVVDERWSRKARSGLFAKVAPLVADRGFRR